MNQPNIINISATSSQNARGHGSVSIFGLGDDSKIYIWNTNTKNWQPFADGNNWD